MIQQYDHVIQLMDRAGASDTPFLFALDYEQQQGIFVPYPLEQEETLFRTPHYTNITPQPHPIAHPELIKHPIPFQHYAQRFDTIQQGMQKGLSVLANLTVATPVETPLSLLQILHATRAPYQLYIPEAHFVCFSPEQFVAISPEGTIATCPMKGTITSDTPGAPDSILNDYKETSEHCAVVDLLRSDLARVATGVHVARFRFFTTIPTAQKQIYQVSSEISGTLPTDWPRHIGATIHALLPAGSILGAPRNTTRSLIATAEQNDPRGFYCGVFGLYDGKALDSAVLIRCISQDHNGHKHYHSGGGITINSNVQKEYQEAIDKVYLPL